MTSKFVFMPRFERAVKHLKKRYRHVEDDLEVALAAVETDVTVGAIIPDDFWVRKIRVASRDMQRGKSGGFRLLYRLSDEENLDDVTAYLLLVYAKTDQADVTRSELEALVDDLPKDDELNE